MSLLDNFCAAYEILEHNVSRALLTQVGDIPRLQEQRRQTLIFLQSVEQVSTLLLSFLIMTII